MPREWGLGVAVVGWEGRALVCGLEFEEWSELGKGTSQAASVYRL